MTNLRSQSPAKRPSSQSHRASPVSETKHLSQKSIRGLTVGVGNVFEKRLIEAYIAENGTDPVNGEELSPDDLVDLKQNRLAKPRPPQLTSIPALLSTFQNEWDALILETFQLKQQLAETRQELSTALYYNDSAQRVIARLQKERDEARDALSRVSVTAAPNGAGQANGDAMQVDGQGLPQDVLGKIDATQAKLSATRRKRPVPEDWATGDEIAAYDVKSKADTQFTGAKSLAVDETGDFFLTGDSDGTVGIYDLKQDAFTTRSNLSAGGINHGAWARDSAVVATASGAVVVTQEGAVKAKFQQHAGAATAVATHPSGELLASVGVDKSLVLYDLQSGKVLTQIFSDAGKSIHWRCKRRRKTVTDIFHSPDEHDFPPRRPSARSWCSRWFHQALRRQDLSASPYLPQPCRRDPRGRPQLLRERHLARFRIRELHDRHGLGSAEVERTEDFGGWWCGDGHLMGLHRSVPGRLRSGWSDGCSVHQGFQVLD